MALGDIPACPGPCRPCPFPGPSVEDLVPDPSPWILKFAVSFVVTGPGTAHPASGRLPLQKERSVPQHDRGEEERERGGPPRENLTKAKKHLPPSLAWPCVLESVWGIQPLGAGVQTGPCGPWKLRPKERSGICPSLDGRAWYESPPSASCVLSSAQRGREPAPGSPSTFLGGSKGGQVLTLHPGVGARSPSLGWG